MKWFSISGVIEEAKRVRWPKREDLVKDFIIVIVFSVFFGLCFFASDFLVAVFLRLFGITPGA